jgi:two-component system, NarL family, nitrate/nitrite response regulator NarL
MGTTMTVRLAIVDDHPVVTDGLQGALSQVPDILVMWTACDMREARRELGEGASVDVVLVDVRLPDGSGLALLPGSRGSTPAFLVLSSFDRPQYASAAFRRGASGYLLKVAPLTEIIDAVRTVASGGLAFEARHLASVASASTLSRREVEVVRLVSTGHSNDEIAARLGIARKTVEAYLTKLFERWGFATRTELAIWAEREGWLDIPRADEVL